MLSLIVPTRQRPQLLSRLINSVLLTADDLRRVELLLGWDSDDELTRQWLQQHGSLPFLTALEVPRTDNLASLQNRLWRASRGSLAWLLNDDTVMLTQGWDTVALERMTPWSYGHTEPRGDLAWADDRRGYSYFPVIGRKASEALGYLAPEKFTSYGVDPYLYTIFVETDLVVDLKEIVVGHTKVADQTRRRMTFRCSHPDLNPDSDRQRLLEVKRGDHECRNLPS